jgi:2-dehydropantoate 2-reductase
MISDAVSNEHTSIVITQNGIGVEEAYKGRFPANLIISGVLYMPSTRVSPTDVVQTERHRIIMGAYPSHALSGEEEHKIRGLASMLNAAGAHAELHEDIQVERWKKLIGNATWNPICALSRCRDVQFLGSSDSAGRFIEAAMREVAAVARAIGYGEEVNEDAIKAQIQRSAIRNYPGVQPSMMADMLGGSRMEVEAIVGQVFRIAEEHGVSVPRLETLYVLAAGLDRSISQKQTSCS